MDKSAITVQPREPLYMRPLSGIAGRAASPVMAGLLGISTPLQETADINPHFQALLNGAAKSTDIGEELDVQFGSVRPLRNLLRIWKNRNFSFLPKVISTLVHPFKELDRSLGRADSYDPSSHSIALFTKDPAILAHELGHARDFAGRSNPMLYGMARGLPGGDLYQEARASNRAIELLKRVKPGQATRAQRVLGGAIGTYAGKYFGVPLPLPGGMHINPTVLIGQVAGATAKPFGMDRSDVKEEKTIRKDRLHEMAMEDAEQRRAERAEKKSSHSRVLLEKLSGGKLDEIGEGLKQYFAKKLPSVDWPNVPVAAGVGAAAGLGLAGLGQLMGEYSPVIPHEEDNPEDLSASHRLLMTLGGAALGAGIGGVGYGAGGALIKALRPYVEKEYRKRFG